MILEKKFKFNINFITLTLPASQEHSDDEIKSVALNNFLNICRKRYNLGEYVWKAESQINGNIHFHIVTDTYIRYDKIQEAWNSSVELLTCGNVETKKMEGYVTRFANKIGHRFPNSTDVHSVKHVKKIASYISKYMSKNRSFHCIGELRIIDGKEKEILYGSDQYRNEEGGKKKGKVIANIIAGPCRRIQGKLWFLSRGLSQCKPVRINEDEHQFLDVQTVIRRGDLHEFKTDFCTNFYGNVYQVCDEYAPWITELMRTVPEKKIKEKKL